MRSTSDDQQHLPTDETPPMKIAHHDALTTREKIDLLKELRATASSAAEIGDGIDINPAEIEAAIEEVRVDAQEGHDPFVPEEGKL